MRTLLTIALGSLLLSTACMAGPEADEELAYEEQGISYMGLWHTFDDPESWWQSGEQSSLGASFATKDGAILYGRLKTWIGRDFTLHPTLPNPTCKVEVAVHFVSSSAMAHFRLKIRPAGSDSAMINHSYLLKASGGLNQTITSPAWTLPTSGDFVVNLIADKPGTGEWNSIMIKSLHFSCVGDS